MKDERQNEFGIDVVIAVVLLLIGCMDLWSYVRAHKTKNSELLLHSNLASFSTKICVCLFCFAIRSQDFNLTTTGVTE